MRITQQTMMRQYNDRLNQIMSDLNKANQKVLTRRKFSEASENPGLAVQSDQLRRQYYKNSNYLENANDVKDRLEEVAGSALAINNSAAEAYNLTNGADGKSKDERLILAGKLDTIAKTLIQQVNANVGDKFIFGGGSTKQVPFELSNGKVTFRGIPVDSPKKIDDPDNPGNLIDNPQYLKLQEMANETMFVDLGFGLKINNGVIDPGTAFNIATPGINYIGFGQNAEGYSNNMIETISQMAEALRAETVDESKFQKLSENLKSQENYSLVGLTNLGTNSQFIESTINRLTASEDLLNTKLVNTELVPQELAITEYQAQDAAYRAALKMGTNILSTSFMDFMR